MIHVTDQNHVSHPVIAVKRINSFLVRVVRNCASRITPFVVHTFNEQDGGFYHGHYCESLEDAMRIFNL